VKKSVAQVGCAVNLAAIEFKPFAAAVCCRRYWRHNLKTVRRLGTKSGGFDPHRYTTAPLQTEGVIRFAGSPEAVLARIADPPAMTD